MIEEMCTLPNGWSRSKVGSLCKMIRGVSYPKVDAKKQLSKGYYPVLRGGNIQDEIIFKDLVFVPSKYIKDEQYIRRFDVVLAMSSGSRNIVGKAAQAKEDYKGSFGAFCGLLRPNKQIEPRFFGYYFKTKDYRTKISNLSAGVNINNLRRGYIENLSIPLPPLPEQKRIIAKIENLLDRLNKTKQELAKALPSLKKFRQSVLARAFNGELTKEWREKQKDLEPASKLLERIREERKKKLGKKYKEPEPIDTSDLPELPEEWVITELRNLVGPNGIFTDGDWVLSEHLKTGKDVRLIQLADIGVGSFLDKSEKFISKQTADGLKVSYLQPGDVLISRMAHPLARACILPDIHKPCITAVDVTIARCDRKICLPEFLMDTCNSNYILAQAESVASGTTRKRISRKKLGELACKLLPLNEQHHIVQKIKELNAKADAIEKSVKIAQTHCEKLTQSILAKAFRGELVEQDPNDESASVLLEKIKVKKEKRLQARR